MTEQELFDGIARKDNRVFQYLYRQHQERILRMVQRNSGTTEDALDLFQEGLVVLWTNIARGKFELRSQAKIGTYLYTLCRNNWISKLRKRKVVHSLDALPELAIADETSELQERHDRIREIEQRLGQLGAACQKMLTLFYYQKVSLREIAQQLALTEKTAKNNKYRCMLKLRALTLTEKSPS